MRERILIINVNWIGDVLFSTPFIRTVRENYPRSHIACLLHPRCREMLEGNPRINEIILYDEEGRHKSLLGKARLATDLRKRRFDAVFLLHRSFTKALIGMASGAKERIGYPTKHRSRLLTLSVKAPSAGIHKVEYFLELARAAGMRVGADRSYEFFIDNNDKSFAKELLKKNGVRQGDAVITLCPGGNWDPKRWPKESFAKVADALADRYKARIVISGSAGDRKLAEDIGMLMKDAPVIISGETSLKQLGAILACSDLVIANDTGSMHLAVAMKSRVIALFGPTSQDITGPYGTGDYKVIFENKSCKVPCYNPKCAENRCMSAISVEEVVRAAEGMLVHGSQEKMEK